MLRWIVILGLAIGLPIVTLKAIGGLVAWAQWSPAEPRQGEVAQVSARDGAHLFKEQCVSCHGDDGRQIEAAPLSSRLFVEALGPRLERAISEGKGIMPAWSQENGGPFGPSDVKSVAAFLRSGQGPAGQETAAQTEPVATALPTAGQAEPSPVEQLRPPPVAPHGIQEAAERCLECHDQGGVAPVPVNHAGRTDSMCAMCHQVR